MAAAFGAITGAASAQPHGVRPTLADAHPALAEVADADPPLGASRLTRSETLGRLEIELDARFESHPLQDVIRYLSLVSGVRLDPLWSDRHHEEGLDPMAPVSLDARGLTALECLEVVLEQVSETQELATGATWQFSPTGFVECGPRERLNRPEARRAELYDIRELLSALPEAGPAPRLNIATAAQPRRPGSGADDWVVPSDATPAREPADETSREDRVIGLIISIVEPAHWVRNGGDAGRIEVVDGMLVVVAPDYMHRGLVGPLGESDGTKAE